MAQVVMQEALLEDPCATLDMQPVVNRACHLDNSTEMGVCLSQVSLVLADCMRGFMFVGVCQPRVSEACAQAACVLLGDDVPARLHWPRHAELRVNNMQYRPYGRSGAMRLGANARDEPASIGTLCFHGRNALSLSAADNRPFCLVVQVRRAACRQGF